MKEYIDAWTKMFQFNGTASLRSFWLFFLIHIVVIIVITIAGKYFFASEIPGNIYTLVGILPLYMLGFRRLRDANLSPWLFLIPIVNIILAVLPTNKG